MGHRLRALIVTAVAATLSVSCGGGGEARESATTPTGVTDLLTGLPTEARATDGGGGPRPPAYWAVWNTCAPDNRSSEANGVGAVLVDDVLADPGIALGDHDVATCDEAVALLTGRTSAGEPTDAAAFLLAAQLLAAELNLNVGAESCPVAEETVVGGHLVLSTAQFDGSSPTPLSGEADGAAGRLIELLDLYNAGELCV